MIFRRIKAHIAKEDWFAVFIDFMIVVFGVFMGFQVQEWNSNRNDRADAQQYRERLATDMELSIVRNDSHIKYQKLQRTQINTILDALDTCTITDNQKPEFAAGLYNLGKISLPIVIMYTIDELNATGKFQLIGDEEMRRLISSTVREVATTEDIDPQVTGRTIPSINYVRTKVRFRMDEIPGWPEEIAADKVIYDFQDLCGDQKFVNSIAAVDEVLHSTIVLNEQARDKQKEVLMALRTRFGVAETAEEK